MPKYVVIRQDDVPGDELPRWEKVKFTSTSKFVPDKSLKFKRGDLLGVVKTEHVSDIENRLTSLRIAVSDRKLSKDLNGPYWFSLYNSQSSDFLLRSLMSESAITHHDAAALAYAYVKNLADLTNGDGLVLYGLTEIRKWLNGEEHCLREARTVIDEDNCTTESYVNDSRISVSYLCDYVLSERYESSVLRNSISCATNAAILLNGRSWHEQDAVAAEIIKTTAPRIAVMLAVAEKRKLNVWEAISRDEI